MNKYHSMNINTSIIEVLEASEKLVNFIHKDNGKRIVEVGLTTACLEAIDIVKNLRNELLDCGSGEYWL